MSVEVKTPTRTQFEHVEFQCGEKQPSSTFRHSDGHIEKVANKSEIDNNSVKVTSRPARQVTISDNQQKSDGSKNFPKRRRFSTPAQRGQGSGFRKRRYSTKQDRIVLPTKFLLGGNIRDPLNLNSLYDDATGLFLNQKTPNCSPLPFPVHRENVNLVIPPNITDPLNLNSGEDIDELTLKFMARKRRRYKHKKKQDEDISSTSVRVSSGKESDKKKNLTLALKIDIDTANDAIVEKAGSDSEIVLSCHKKCEDKIVSPVIPQSVKSRKRRRTVSECMKPEFLEGLSSTRRALLRTEIVPFDHDLQSFTVEPVAKKIKRQISSCKPPQQQPKPQTQMQVERKRKNSSNTQKKFIYGNYNRYYGYRNAEIEEDTRLSILRTEWFEGKDVLDIGCNVGHITLAIARDFRPRKIVGMDIDGRLISAARKNIRHYLTASTVKTDQYPLSAKLNYGPIVTPTVNADKKFVFPNNIMFLQGNYVLEFDELLDSQKEDYDIIMALSITKWIHLNFGDAGMKRFFKRIFKQLRPGGKLILEPQAWPSYKKKKKLTESIASNFQTIKFKPDQFTDFLLSREVGFSTCEAIQVPFNKSAGFRRPIQLFSKPDTHVNSPHPVASELFSKPDTHVNSPHPVASALFSKPDTHVNSPNPVASELFSKPDTHVNSPNPVASVLFSKPDTHVNSPHPVASALFSKPDTHVNSPHPVASELFSKPDTHVTSLNPVASELFSKPDTHVTSPNPVASELFSKPDTHVNSSHPVASELFSKPDTHVTSPNPVASELFSKPDTHVNSPNPVASEKEDTKIVETVVVPGISQTMTAREQLDVKVTETIQSSEGEKKSEEWTIFGEPNLPPALS